MNYKHLTEKNKVEIDILLKQNLSMREVGRRLGISHSTISRYKANKYKKRIIDINEKYKVFIKYLFYHCLSNYILVYKSDIMHLYIFF